MHDACMSTPTTSITTLLALPPDLVERDRVRRQAMRAGAVQHPGLASLRSVAFAGDGLALTWEIPAGSHLIASDDDPICAVAPVAAGLALLHDAGLAHGGVRSDAVHVSDGRGCLAAWQPGGTPEGDVLALVSMLDHWLPRGSVGADVVQVLVAGADPDPTVRPSMARVAAVLDGAARRHSPPISPPAQRRARLDDAPPPRIVEPVAATVPSRRAPEPTSSAPRARGRHAAHRASAGAIAIPRVSWRWGLALAGGAAAALLGLSAMGSTGAAQEICPAPVSQGDAPARPIG